LVGNPPRPAASGGSKTRGVMARQSRANPATHGHKGGGPPLWGTPLARLRPAEAKHAESWLGKAEPTLQRMGTRGAGPPCGEPPSPGCVRRKQNTRSHGSAKPSQPCNAWAQGGQAPLVGNPL